MSVIHIPRRRFEQPRGMVEAHPDWAPRLASLINFGAGEPVDLIDRGAKYVRSGGAILTPHQRGIGLRTKIGGAQDEYIESSGAMASWSGEPTLVFHLPEIAAAQDPGGSMLHAVTSEGSYTFFDYTGSYLYILGSGSYSLGEGAFGTRNRSLIIRAAGSDPSIFLDRKKIAATTRTIGAGAKTVRIAAWSSRTYQFAGVYGSVATIKGAITDAEAREFVDYPYLAYRPRIQRIYSIPAAGGALALTSLTMSNPTSSGARATLGITR